VHATLLLLCHLLAAAPDAGLERARALLSTGDYGGAAGAALGVIADRPGSGAAYLVLGVAHFRAGKYEEALAAFRSARGAADPPGRGQLAFNEGSTLYALGRFGEAETAFREAGQADAKLAAVATLNAGLAAFALGATARARSYLAAVEVLPATTTLGPEIGRLRAELDAREAEERAARARALRDKGKAALVAARYPEAIAAYRDAATDARARGAGDGERAELAYAEAVATYRMGRFGEAAPLFGEAVRLVPGDADYQYMAALCALKQDQPEAARAGFERALALGLDAEGASAAGDYLDALSLGLRATGSGLSLALDTGFGYDSNASQLGTVRNEALSAEEPEDPGDLFWTMSMQAAGGLALGRRLFGQLSYDLDQIAYRSEDFDGYSFQTHALFGRAELSPPGPVSVGVAVGGEYQLTGLREFAPFQRVLTVEPGLTLEESARTATRLRLRWQSKQSASAEDRHLDGTRFEVRASQLARWRDLRGELAYRHRREDLGDRTVDLGMVGRRGRFEGRYQIPYGYTSNGLSLDLTVNLATWARLEAEGSYEELRYRRDNVLTATGALGRQVERRVRRHDRRLGFGAALVMPLGSLFELGARYDLAINDSNVAFAFDDKTYSKHMFLLEGSGAF
jgi:tetratricopeptide (TPR) repeat protein